MAVNPLADPSGSSPTPLRVQVPDDVQRLWFALDRKPWNVLVLMPADSSFGTGPLAMALAQAGSRVRGLPVQYQDAQDLELPRAARVIEQAVTPSKERSATIIAVGSPLTSPAAIPVALAADGVLMCVELGRSQIQQAQRTIELIGRARFMGAVAVTPLGFR